MNDFFPTAIAMLPIIVSPLRLGVPSLVGTTESSSGPIALLPHWYIGIANAIYMQRHITCSCGRLPSIKTDLLHATLCSVSSSRNISPSFSVHCGPLFI